MATCYRHPDRETNVSCSNCGRPICPDCMRQTPVGVRCPECAGQRAGIRAPAFLMANRPRVTYGLIAANVVMLLVTNRNGGLPRGGGLFSGGTLNSLGEHLALYGPAVQHGQYYRLVTAAFVHYGLIHLAFNMYALYWLGSALESYAGSVRFAIIYAISLLSGSFAPLGNFSVSGNGDEQTVTDLSAGVRKFYQIEITKP